MTVTIEKLDNNEVKLNIEIEPSITSWEYDKACKKLAQRVNVPGFRQGKAPKPIIEKYVGIAALQREVLQSLLPTIFESAITENNFDIVNTPNVESYEFADDKTLKVVAKLELKPEVNLCEYKGIEVNVEEFKSENDVVDKELKILQDRFATLNDITDRKTLNTDIVNIDFNGYVDGEEIKGGSAKGYILDLAHSNFIPGFAEQLVDKPIGEEFKINVGAISSTKPYGIEGMYYDGGYIVLNQAEYPNVTIDRTQLLIQSSNTEELVKDIENIDKDIVYSNLEEAVKAERAMILVVKIFLYGFITIITLIGVTNIFNTITSNMELRQKEFAMLKSIGMTKKEFNRMINLETIFYSAKSLIYGIALGLLGTFAMYKAFSVKFDSGMYIPINPIIISIIAVFILVFIIMKYSINKINKQNVIETIRKENI